MGDYSPSYLSQTIKQHHFIEWNKLSSELWQWLASLISALPAGREHFLLGTGKAALSPPGPRATVELNYSWYIPQVVTTFLQLSSFYRRELFLHILLEFYNTCVHSSYLLLSFMVFFKKYLGIPKNSPKKIVDRPFHQTSLIMNRFQPVALFEPAGLELLVSLELYEVFLHYHIFFWPLYRLDCKNKTKQTKHPVKFYDPEVLELKANP